MRHHRTPTSKDRRRGESLPAAGVSPCMDNAPDSLTPAMRRALAAEMLELDRIERDRQDDLRRSLDYLGRFFPTLAAAAPRPDTDAWDDTWEGLEAAMCILLALDQWEPAAGDPSTAIERTLRTMPRGNLESLADGLVAHLTRP